MAEPSGSLGTQLPRVMLITDQGLADPVTPILAALGGVDVERVLVQVRLKTWTPGARREAALRLRASGAPLVINSDVGLARELGVGVHLPERANPLPALGDCEGMWVGRSCHDASSLARAEAEGASYVTLGPVGAVPDKGIGRGVAWVGEHARACVLPVYALGGVELAQVPLLRAVGVHGVALMRGVAASAAPRETLRALLALTR